jgi:DNA-binding transcriptional MerR regulator
VVETVSKGPEAFRTISEVAGELNLPQHVLRFWETRFVHIRPMKRGGGRRYYRPDDIELLRGIRQLLYGEGYTIRGVQRLLKEQGPRFVIGAGRGEMSGIGPADDETDLPDLETVEIDGALSVEIEEEMIAAEADEPGHIEPTFDPREFRPSAPTGEPRAGVSPRARHVSAPSGMSVDDVRRLQSTLTDLLELKRLLDQARD